MISGDSASEVVLAREYSQYGEVTSHSGEAEPLFGFTGELQAGGLVHLRARDYDPVVGRFVTRDSWEGDTSRPLSLNKWMYVEGNPITRNDPTGNNAIWLTNNDAAEGFGHSSILIENGHTNQWYYFYFGPKNAGKIIDDSLVVVERVPDYVLNSMEDLNSWLTGNIWQIINYTGKTNFPGPLYSQSVYIKGDFSQSLKYIENLPDSNNDYSALTNNCLQQSKKAFKLGKFNNGENINFKKVDIHGFEKYFDIDIVVPNNAQTDMEDSFMNNAYTVEEMKSDIDEKISYWERIYGFKNCNKKNPFSADTYLDRAELLLMDPN